MCPWPAACFFMKACASVSQVRSTRFSRSACCLSASATDAVLTHCPSRGLQYCPYRHHFWGGHMSSWTKHDYEDIPGTYVFDGRHAYGAYPLNKLLFSFCDEANRTEFDKDPAAYCDKF